MVTTRRPSASRKWWALTIAGTLILALPLISGAVCKKGACKDQAPSIEIDTPDPKAVIGGIVSVSGFANDDRKLARVEVGIDGSPLSIAYGTTSWATQLDTRTFADGEYRVLAKAIDNTGNATTVTETVTIANGATAEPGLQTPDEPEPAPEPGPASEPEPEPEPEPALAPAPADPAPAPSVDPRPSEDGRWISPEGVRIEVAPDVQGWTALQVYDLLVPSARQLALVGPSLTVLVQTTYASQVSVGASTVNGRYSSVSGVIYLDARSSSTFTSRPDFVVAHEYGHMWTLYHLYLTQQGDWSRYLRARGIEGDPRLDTSYGWSRTEMIADDYRLLFGSSNAVAQVAYLNPDVPDPRLVPGLAEFFRSTWGG